MGRHHRADVTRAALLDAALVEFSASGFEAASTRAIAARAGVHQPQINFHFASKQELWRAAVDHLFEQVDAIVGPAIAEAAADDTTRGLELDLAVLDAGFRALVRAAARHPELNRIMVHEATSDSERLAWIVDRHVRRRFELVTTTWERLRAAGRVADIEPTTAYYMAVGAASLMYANAPEARRLLGHDPIRPGTIELHADALVSMLLLAPAHTTATPLSAT
jgi:TetR/AcrR family transcriptional regulator